MCRILLQFYAEMMHIEQLIPFYYQLLSVGEASG